MKMSLAKRRNFRLQHILFVVLLLGFVGLLAWLSTQYSYRSDWTAGARNSLSDATIKLLKEMPDPITIRVYLQDDPAAHEGVTDLLKRYKNHDKNFNYRIVNPDLEIDLAKADKITRYGQTLVKYGKRHEIIEGLNEQSLTNALVRLNRSEKPLAIFITGHGERDAQSDANTGYNTLASKLLEKGFDARSLNLLDHDIPKKTRVLVIAAPSHKLLPGEVAKIQQYIKSGGNLLWLHDPGELHGLEPLTKQLGVEFPKGVVVDTNPTLRQTLRIQHPAVIPVLTYFPHKITEGLKYNTLFAIASPVKAVKDSGWEAKHLFNSLPGSWIESKGFTMDVAFDPDQGDVEGPVDLAYALERKPEKSDRQQRVVVVGDSDFLANSYVGAGANLMLAMNMFNWLSQDDQLIAIDPKKAPDTKLVLQNNEILFISLLFLVVIPVTLLGSGIFIWYRRRNR